MSRFFFGSQASKLGVEHICCYRASQILTVLNAAALATFRVQIDDWSWLYSSVLEGCYWFDVEQFTFAVLGSISGEQYHKHWIAIFDLFLHSKLIFWHYRL